MDVPAVVRPQRCLSLSLTLTRLDPIVLILQLHDCRLCTVLHH